MFQEPTDYLAVIRVPVVVGIQESDKNTFWPPRRLHSAPPIAQNAAQCYDLSSIGLADLSRAIGRTVVHNDDLTNGAGLVQD